MKSSNQSRELRKLKFLMSLTRAGEAQELCFFLQVDVVNSKWKHPDPAATVLLLSGNRFHTLQVDQKFKKGRIKKQNKQTNLRQLFVMSSQ